MKIEKGFIEVLDREGTRIVEMPRERITSVFADVSERWVANVLVPKRVCEKLIPLPFLKPVETKAGYVLSLCAIFMRHAAPQWAPLAVGPASKNCALRIACVDERDGTPAVWVDDRYSDSRLVEALSILGFPEVRGSLTVEAGEDFYDHRKLDMRTKNGEIDLRLVEYPETTRIKDRAFENCAAFEEYFIAGIRSYGPGVKQNAAAIVDLHKRSDNHFEPMANYFGYLRTELGSWPVESVYRTRNGLYEWRYEGDVEY